MFFGHLSNGQNQINADFLNYFKKNYRSRISYNQIIVDFFKYL